MTYFVYVLGSYKNSKLITYVGYTNNLKKRLYLHNNGKGAKFTRGRTWKIIYSEKHLTKNKAIHIKKGEVDSRQRKIFLNEKGKKIFDEIFFEQKKRIYNALKNSDSESVIKFKNVLNKIINE